MSRVETKTRPKASREEYIIPCKQKERLEKKLETYKKLMGTSVDDQAAFDARYKEVLAIGRQSAKDRLRAGQILIEMEREIKELGYPFWPWLAAQFEERIPERTARRAMDIAWHFETVANLGDRTITEALKEAQEARAKKTKAKTKAKRQEDVADEGEAEAGEDGTLGKDLDNVSGIFPISSNPGFEEGPDDDLDQEEGDQEDEDAEGEVSQCNLQNDLGLIEGDLHTILKAVNGKLGAFPDPENIVKQIDKCIDLLSELKAKVPVSAEQ